MKKNKINRQLAAYYRIRIVLNHPEDIKLEETKKGRLKKETSIEEVCNRLQNEMDILKDKLKLQGIDPEKK
jgi:hypothetical protein